MYGRQPPRNGGAGGPPPPYINPNYLHNSSNFHLINPNLHPAMNPFIQNPVFPIHNPNFPIHNPNFHVQNQVSHPNFIQQNPSFHAKQKVSGNRKSSEGVERIERAVVKARGDLLASGESVSCWKVSQAALLALKADSWESLGFQMQQVPSLHRLMKIEGKINSFIHCFVGVQTITSLSDLEKAICENEGVQRFEELELGPLIRHPLVTHYFCVSSDVTKVYRISTEEIISCLGEYLDTQKGKEIKADKLLDFIAKKRSITSKEKLTIRIQSLGLHIDHIQQGRRIEDTTLKKCLIGSRKTKKKRPLFSTQKKQLDENFSTISQRIKSFSSTHGDISGTHIRFGSSSSEDDDSDDYGSEGNENDNSSGSHSNISSRNVNSSERVSSCPYPSAAEEMTRLGMKDVGDSPSVPGGSPYIPGTSGPSKNKRKCDTNSAPRKLAKRDGGNKRDSVTSSKKKASSKNEVDLSLPDDSMRMFLTTWKEACRENTVDEVCELVVRHPVKVFYRMCNFYEPKRTKKMVSTFSTYPYIGLLNVAVNSIKYGMWDSMYDSFQALGQQHIENTIPEKPCNFISIEVEPSEKNIQVVSKSAFKQQIDVSVEDIIRRISTFFEDYHDHPGDLSPIGKKYTFLKELYKCENWLVEQFSVEKFESLGYGEFLIFIEKHLSLLPPTFQMCLATEDTSEKLSLEACMPRHLLDVLLAQASNGLLENEKLSSQKISDLLTRQFPAVCFKLVTETEDFSEIAENRSDLICKGVLFSSALSVSLNENTSSDLHLMSKDAIEVLLRAPMLADLDLWSHWDVIFAPSLGPLIGWLLNELNTKELLCLVTRSGNIIRIDHSATVDSFLGAFLQGSSFQTAVKLLSLFAVYGGEKNVPLPLLKCHAQKAFEVMRDNSIVKEENNAENYLRNKLNKHKKEVDKAVAVASIFFLDCLAYLPVEFRRVAADILLSGFRCIFKDAPSAILSECKQTHHRLMLHDLGLLLGIAEWINDFHAFSLPAASTSFEPDGKLNDMKHSSAPAEGEIIMSVKAEEHNEECGGAHTRTNVSEIHGVGFDDAPIQCLSEVDGDKDSSIVIESIRREEFGLDPNLSVMGINILQRQHARLGRALHCLSQELYSQDSHFLLELVQNADDNVYPSFVEPTLSFILKKGGIVVLNNEQGFSAENIRALCDVGNSTKKNPGAGYIGKKGIGFKSVFRVTDTPEIHSNGFHIKFDITEGQIGFVLPTIVPPCDIDSFNKLVSADTEPVDKSSWNTCIILPFKSKHTEDLAMDNIISMFSDLHPSLLLFLHRLECIKFRNLLRDSLIVMRKQVVGDGIVNVSLGKEKMTWFVESRVLQADAIRDDVQTTEISVAFTLEESSHGNYIPKLHQQPVFAFLPLRTYGLKFILQGDFILPSSREEVDGNSPWNQWLLSEFPNLFVNAERSFCSLPCFIQNPGLGVSAFMSFVPLTGEVHGFFSSLPRMIISKLRMANCLLLEGNNNDWVPPCKVLRNWTEQARSLLPDDLIREHLGLGLLNKDIVLTDSLARALGVEEYGPKVLLQIMYSLCRTENGLKSMGLGWLSSWLAALHAMSYNSSSQSTVDVGNQLDIINNLKKIPFIPLLDGSYGSIDEGTIWLHTDALEGFDFEHGLEAFEKLYANLRIVSPALFNDSVIENLTPMLYKIGVKKLSPHEVLKMHILPAISDEKHTAGSNDLMTEYLSFIMSHLQSTCPSCYAEREFIISEVRNKALISTNHGYKRLVEVPIHFSKDYGNPIDINKIISGIDVRWHEVDCTYLKHPVIKSSSGGMLKWRKFLQELGVTDFTLVVQVEKSLADVSHSVLKNMMWENERLSPGSTVKDWESRELVHLVSQVSSSGDPKRCKYLLEVLDTLWDDYFSDKVTGYCNINGKSKPFRSSVISVLHDMQWLASNMDNELHHPKDLFHDCDAVRSVLGETAPYAVPKTQSQKLLKDIGFKSTVTLDDTLAVLQVWRGSRTPFRASISQMSKFYTFIWNEASSTEQKILENLRSGAFIFVPYLYHSTHEVVPGSFLSAQEVYWNDSTGSLEQMKLLYPQYDRNMTHRPFNKMLCNIYPALYDFFVKECGVTENPPLLGYLQILLQLSAGTLPTQAAKTVFQVFLKWGDGLNSGLLSPEDVEHLKKSLEEKETMVLPTALDKWVSLHPSFGLVCWSDDDELKKEFKNLNNIDFLYLGELNDEEKVMVRAKVSPLFRRLGIPMLSEVVTREAVYYGLADSSFKASLVSWALPFAQRYIYSVHPNEYTRLKLSGFEILNRLQIVVVEKLFYRNVIKRPDVASNKRFECSCLLQGTILYTTRESDSHSLFREVSRFLLHGVPELPLANFLHMITTMAESGSTENQTEFFILNCQKIPNLPDGETIWSLQSLPSPATNEENLITSAAFTNIIEPNPTKTKTKSEADSNWPPVNWKNAPGFDFAYKTQPFSSPQVKNTDMAEEYSAQSETRFSNDINADWKIEENPASRVPVVVLQDSEDLVDGSDIPSNMVNSDTNIVCSADLGQPGSSYINERDQLSVGTVNPQQALLTGRLGEIVAYKYFSGKAGDKSVKWVNEVNESGLPFDIIIEDKEKGKEYIEVKATRSGRKDWFEISVKEWQFAVEKGEYFSIARVVLSGNKLAQVTTYRNPVKLSQLRQLQLAVVLPKQTKDSQVISLDPNSLSYTSGCM